MESNPLMERNESDHTWSRRPRLLLSHEIPWWQRDNEYLLSGCRPTSGSAGASFASLAYLYNQSIKMYLHLIGCIMFFILPFYFHWHFYQPRLNARIDDLVVISVYCLGVTVCFALSAIFHIMWNDSQNLTSLCNKLDYLSILILMWGAGISTIYYGFFCNQDLQRFYWMITSCATLCCAIATFRPRFASPLFRRWRVCFYGGFGLSAITYVAHGISIHGWDLQRARMSLYWMAGMATFNLAGAIIYAARVPERFIPFKFDIFGASHQLFHVAVIIAAVILVNPHSILCEGYRNAATVEVVLFVIVEPRLWGYSLRYFPHGVHTVSKSEEYSQD
ncbi:putative mPR-likeG-protein-coupled receptor [Trichoderma sp. SZMC 28013]